VSKTSELPIINVKGEKVALGPLRSDLVPTYLRWMNDFDVTRTLATGMRPMTAESEESWYQRAIKDPSEVHFTLYERDNLKAVGVASLIHIEQLSRSAEFGIVIGDKDYWNRGLGTEATALLLSYGFIALNLHNILLKVHADNERAIRAYERAGFQPCGRRRQAHWRSGQPVDMLFMDCISTEFDKRLPGLLR
jgi:RimJ/RimL family protein N-acetyltransferase